MEAKFNKKMKGICAWPTEKHPLTREPFTGCENIEEKSNIQTMRYMAPQKPERTYDIYNEADEITGTRTMTKREYAKELRQYEKDRIHHAVTRGQESTVIGSTITGTFTCKSGATATGIWGQGKWCWLNLTYPAVEGIS